MEESAQKKQKEPFIVTGADGKSIAIQHGQYYFNTKARCKRMAQNSLSAEARRVYAVLELGTMGFQQEIAVLMEGGEKRRMTPDDIAKQSGLARQEVRSGLEQLEVAGLAERFSDDGGTLRKGHVNVRSWAEPHLSKVKDCRGAPLQFPDWWPKPDPETPHWTDSWASLRSLVKRRKLNVFINEESARDYKSEGDEVARAYQEAEIVAARFLERVCAQPRINKEERTERTSSSEDSSSSSLNGRSSSSIAREEEEDHPIQEKEPETQSVGNGASAAPARERIPSFEEFRKAYPPSRMDAAAAATAYRRSVKTPADHAALMRGLQSHLACERWRRSLDDDNPPGRFIPMASRFLSERRYLHDPDPYIAAGSAPDPVIEMLRKEGYR